MKSFSQGIILLGPNEVSVIEGTIVKLIKLMGLWEVKEIHKCYSSQSFHSQILYLLSYWKPIIYILEIICDLFGIIFKCFTSFSLYQIQKIFHSSVLQLNILFSASSSL